MLKKIISLISCALVCASIFCVPFNASVKTSTSGIHVEAQTGKDGKTYMVQVKDPGPQITIDETKVIVPDHDFFGKPVNSYIMFEGYLSKVDTTNKCIIINFGGYTDNTQKLKDLGFKLVNPKGAEISFWDAGACNFKVPYSDLSFVKEMYITYGDQKVKMTVA